MMQSNLIFSKEKPILFDEWQEMPLIWNAIRKQVDNGAERGSFT
jgi:hypothetical protein